MGCQNYNNIVVAWLWVVVVLAAANPPVHGQISGPIAGLGTGLNIISRVCCTPSGNCSPGATGLANVTGVVRCLNPVTGALREVGRAISTANGTMVINVPISELVRTNLVGLLSDVGGTTTPCVLTGTLGLVNQAACPSINAVSNAILLGMPGLINSGNSANIGVALVAQVLTINANA